MAKKKCPVCQSSRITENDKREKACNKCSYIWKPTNQIVAWRDS